MTSETRIPLPMASTGCACCAPAPGQTAPTVETAPSAGTSTVYRVEGMTCGHCVKNVTEELTALDGVSDVHIDLVAGGASTVTVTADRPGTVHASPAVVCGTLLPHWK